LEVHLAVQIDLDYLGWLDWEEGAVAVAVASGAHLLHGGWNVLSGSL